MHVAVKLGQRSFGGGAQPQDSGQRCEEKQREENAKERKENNGPAAFAGRNEGRKRRLQRG